MLFYANCLCIYLMRNFYKKDERQQRLKELLGVLKRGIEIDHFQISRLESTAVVRRVFWLVSMFAVFKIIFMST